MNWPKAKRGWPGPFYAVALVKRQQIRGIELKRASAEVSLDGSEDEKPEGFFDSVTGRDKTPPSPIRKRDF